MIKKTLTSLPFLLLLAGSAVAGPVEDQMLKSKLEEAYRNSKEIHARFDSQFYWDQSDEVKVSVTDGVVTLRGFVANNKARRSFIRIASELEGVEKVEAKIRVIPYSRKIDY